MQKAINSNDEIFVEGGYAKMRVGLTWTVPALPFGKIESLQEENGVTYATVLLEEHREKVDINSLHPSDEFTALLLNKMVSH